MSRRDTILIAVFINTGVLGLLFLMGVNKEELVDRPEEFQIAEVVTVPQTEVAEAAPIIVSRAYDEPPEIEEDNDNDFDFDAVVLTQKQAENDSSEYQNGFFEVKVKRGDFLERIARANGTTVEEIKKINQLSSEKISVGQILRIPNKSATKSEPVAQAAALPVKSTPAPAQLQNTSEPVYYVVKSGDNPWKIAKQFNIRVDQLLKLNNLNETKAKNLKVGDKLRVK